MLRTPLFYQVERNSSSVRIMDNGNRVIAEGMTPQEAREATKRCNVHLDLVNALKAMVAAYESNLPDHVNAEWNDDYNYAIAALAKSEAA